MNFINNIVKKLFAPLVAIIICFSFITDVSALEADITGNINPAGTDITGILNPAGTAISDLNTANGQAVVYRSISIPQTITSGSEVYM